MIRSKREVDKHVAKVERNVQNPREKALKGYGIARLYFEAKDYDQARKYLAGYIGVSNNDAKAHRFMGQLWEASQDHSKALGCYKRSLEINPAQKDLVLKVAEVYCSVKDDPQRMQYWADKAGALFPGHPTVFNLKERIMTSQGGSVDDMEDLIGEQMAAHPKDAHLHIRLIKLYQDNDRLEEAYDHCTSVERTRVFKDSAEWYSCMANTLQTYLDQRTPPSPSSDDTHTVYIQLLSALSSLVRLRLAETSISQCSHVLRRFDRCLVTASQLTAPGGGEGGEEWRAVLEEMTGQIYWLAGTLLLKQAQQGQLTWTDAMPLVTACYLVSYQSAAPDTRAPWVTVADPARQLPPPTCWYDMACCRLSQVGHMLESLQVDQGSDWVEDCQLKFCNPQGRERVFYVLFGYGTDNNRSFLLTSDCFTRQDIELPDTDDLIQYDMVAVHDQPGELQPVVWLGLQWFSTEDSIQPDCGLWVSRLFPELQFTTTDLKSGAPLSVCLLDIQAFVYATVYTSTLQLRQENIPYGQMEPRILPLPLSRYLCSQAQRDWWAATYRLYTGTAEMGTLAKQKLTLQRGLEVVRCVGNHGLHANLLVHLAETFAARMGEVQESSEQPWFYKEQWSALQERSAHYWSTVIPLLQRLQQNLTVLTPKDPLFPHLNRDIPGSKISELLEEGRLFLAQTAAQQGKSEEALKMLRTMKTAEAARHMAQIYKFLANKQLEDLEDADEDEEQQKRAEWETLLSKARNCLTLALERLGEDKTNPLYLSIMKEIQAIDEDLGKAHDQLTDQLDGEGSPLFTSSTAGSPPRQQARGDGHSPVLESPSSVAAQLKALTLDNSRLLETCTRSEQRVQELTEQMRFLMDEFKDMKNSSGTPSRSVGQSMSTQTPPDEKTAQPTADASYLPQPGFATPHYGYAQTPPYGYAYTTPLAYGGVQHGFATPTHGYAGYSALQHAMYHSSQVAAASQESATQMLAAATGVTTPARVPAVVPSAVNMTSTPAATASGHDQTPLLRSLIMSTPTNTKPAAAMASDDPQKGPPNQTMRTSDSISLTRASTEPSQPLSVTIPPEHIKSPVYQNQGYSPSMLQASQRSYVHTVVHGPNPTTQFAATSPRAQLQQGMPLTTQNIQGFMQATQPAAFTGLMKPGVATTTLQPGTLQPGTLQPGTLQPGTLQPGMPGYNQAMQAAALRMGLAQGYPQAVSPRAMQIPQAQLAGRPGITTGVPQLSQGGQTIPATQSLPAATSPRGVQMGVHSRLGVVGGIPVSSQALSAAAAAGGFFSFSTASQMPGTELSGIATKYPILTTMVNPNTFQSTPTFTVPRSLTPQFGEYSDQSKSQSDEEEVSTPDSEEPSETNIQIGPGYFRPPGESPITFAPIIGEGEQSSDLTKSPSKELFVTGEERMFQRPEEVDRENQELASDEDTEAHDDGIHFEPIVTLPDEVELKTGEEDEDELFVHRAKLFRFDKDNHQWKERGLGNIKVLKNRHNQRCRILMRRDQVLKICCNHYITADMAMKPNAGSNRSWVWVAMDFAEEGGTKEQFAVRFKEAETALEFKNRVDEAIQIITSMPATSSKKSPAKQASPVKEPPSPAKPLSPKKPPSPTKTKDQEVPVAFGQPSEPTMSFRDMFKPKPGSWDCPACMISNTGDKDACVACMTQKPGTSLKPSEPTMSFGDMFKPKPGSWDCPTCMVSNTGDKDACLACTTPKPGTAPKPTKPGFSFGAMFSQDAASQPTVPFGATGAAAKPGVGTVSQSGFSFVSTGQSGFGFGTSQQTAETTQPKTGFSFGFAVPETSTTSQTTALTGFQFKPTQPETSDSAQSGGFSFKLDQSQPSQSGFGLNFGQSQPSAPNQSGFKFALSQSQPSEGSQPATGTEGSKFTFGDVKAVTTVSTPVVCLVPGPRTSTPIGTPEKQQRAARADKATADGDPDVIFVYEKKPTPDQIERAKKYLLPPTFYLYEDKPLPEGWTEEDKLDDKPERRVVKGAEMPSNDSEAVGSKTSQSTNLFGTASSNLMFADLTAGKTQDFAWGKSDKPFGGFQGAGTQLFGTLNTSQESDGGEPSIEEERDDIYFEPIIPLPEKVELVTGEEDERVLYEQRAKLFRWDKGTNQWKERGVGNIKFLQHKTTKRIRIIMRRDQVLKVCANHFITTDMTLKPNAGSERSWVWHAMDCSDEEPGFEQFAARFKTTEIAEEFHKRFEQCQAMLIDVMPPSPSKNAGPSRESQLINSAEKLKSELKSLKEQFAAAAPGMQSPREAEEQEADTLASMLRKERADTPGSIDRLEWDNYDLREDSSHDTSNQSFFGSTSQPASFSFSASFADSRNMSLNLNKTEPEEDEYYQDDEEDNIHFSPIATLPENVEHVTGEEDDTTLFEHRAKLYRFDTTNQEWKERGVGDIKILQNLADGRVRVVMRRERIMKLCANHHITTDMKLQPNKGSDRSWVWTAMDFAEEELKTEQLAVKFKNKEVADEFRNHFEFAQDLLRHGKICTPPASGPNTQPGTPEIEKLPEMNEATSRALSRQTPTRLTFDIDAGKKQDASPKSDEQATPPKDGSVVSPPKFTFGDGQPTKPTVISPSKWTFGSPATDSSSTQPAISFVPSTKPSFSFATISSSTTPFSFSLGSSSTEESFFTAPTTTAFGLTSIAERSEEASSEEASPTREKAPTDLSQRSPEKAGQLSTMTLGPTLTSDPSVEIIYEKEPSAKQLTRALTYRLPPTFYFYEDLPAPEGYRPDEDFDDYEIWFDQWKAGKALRKDAPQPAQKTSTPTKTTPSRSTTDGTIQGATGGQEPTGGASTDMFGNTSVASLSFASLATTDGGFAFGKTDSFKPFSFAGAGATLFGGASSQDAHGDDDHVPENHDIHFEPIVSLPKVEVRTGEEDEAVVYSQRSRLYRWDKDTSQWKERGLGEMKILQHKQETRFRSVMRREQVLKVCCNHLIKPDMDLKPNAGSDRSWVWSAMDYSEEPKFEQFAIKFKTIELAQVYKDKVEECKAILAEAERTSGVPASSESSPVKVNRQDTLASQTPETSPVKENRQQASAPQTPEVLEKSETESPEKSPAKGFGDLFKTKPGSWDCEVCMVNNPGEKAKCLACSTPKPGMSAASSTADGGSKSLSALFKPKVDTWDCSVCMVNNPADKTACLACSTPKPGTNVQAATATSSSGISGTGFIFKQPGTASASFGGVDTATVTSSSGIPGSGFSFKQPGTASASFGGVDTATVTSSSGIPGSGFSFKQPGTASTSFGGFNLSNPSGSTFGQPAASSGSVFGKASSGTGVGFTFGSPAKPAESTGFVFGGPSTASQPATGTGFSFGLKADETAFNTSSPFFSQPGKEMPSIGDLAKQSLLGAETGAKPLSFADALKQKATDFALGGQDSSSGTTPPSTLFGDTSSTTDTSATSLSFKEMANQAGGFKFTFSPEKIIPASKASAKSPLKSPIRSPKKDDGDFYESDGGEDIHFEPIVKLPEKIELKTGEEEEEQLFKFRAKLFRWDADLNQWKERGIGDIKILRHKTTNRSRVLMRREQVLKLCANHLITGAMSLHPNSGSDRSWVWTAVDAAEDEPKPEQFAVRFKLPETAAEFKTYFDQCVETAKMYSSPTKGTSGQNPPDDSPAAGAAASPKTPIRSCDPKLSATLQDIETEIADAIKEDDDNDNHGGTNESNQSGNVSSSDNAESEGFTLVSSPEQTTHSDGC
ncbi:E3 SUMO-protein ligase RanBP2-like isoform X2 [Branchiostoma lanceolatum]|uniref:E3 SUMO-protein ligase RanBP2-like isoform X2 n=1 Tax=Branchiostoma lanceolatum TaxID=7740 RepID=UPI003451E33B